MPSFLNRAWVSTATTGTGTMTLGPALTGYQTIAAAGGVDGASYRYLTQDGSAWEIGLGTYTASGTTLTRVLGQSSTGSLLNLSGAATVAIIEAAADQVGRLINIQRITATGAYTYTPTEGTNSIIIELQGAGAGGAGVASASSAQVNLGGGGGAGAWLQKRLTANFSGGTGSVGTKGTGGTAGNNNGLDGGATTFIDTAGSPTTYTAGGGVKGTFRGSFGPPITHFEDNGGTATNGDINVSGGRSGDAQAGNAFTGWSCAGGDSHYGRGGFNAGVVNANSSAGNPGSGKGSGGSGAVSANGGGSKAGGDGTDGIVIIYEYS